MGVRSFVQNIKSGNVSGAVGDAVGIALGRMAFDDMTDLSMTYNDLDLIGKSPGLILL